MATPRCFKISPNDNVATMLDDAEGGGVSVLGGDAATIVINGPIKLGHKVALCDIAPGEAVIKFGVAIGHASVPIKAGDWVHLHNLASNFDERSQTLDLHTGASTDTRYE